MALRPMPSDPGEALPQPLMPFHLALERPFFNPSVPPAWRQSGPLSHSTLLAWVMLSQKTVKRIAHYR